MPGGGIESGGAAVLTFTNGTLDLGAKPTSGQVLTYNGTSVTGSTLGGGGTATPTAVGDIMYSADGATWTRLAAGAIGRHLAISGSGIPSWREMAQQGTAAARPAASIAVEAVLYWSTDAAAGLELAQCVHTGSGAYSWMVMAHDVTATGAALAQAASAAAARTALSLVPGTDVQAYSAVLAALVANGTPGASGLAVLAAASAAVGLAALDGLPNTRTTATLRTSDTAIVAGDSLKVLPCDASGGNFAQTLPALSSVRGLTFVLKGAADTGIVTVTRAGSDTIDGQTTKTMSGRESFSFYAPSAGTDWYVL